MIKITRKAIGNHDRLYLSDSYLSNGHWLITRNQLASVQNNAGALATLGATVKENMTDADMVKATASAVASDRTWTVTSWLYESGKREALLRIAVAKDGSRIAFREDYCRLFDLTVGQTIYAKDGDSVAQIVRSDDGSVGGFLMPVRAGDIAELPALPVASEVAA